MNGVDWCLKNGFNNFLNRTHGLADSGRQNVLKNHTGHYSTLRGYTVNEKPDLFYYDFRKGIITPVVFFAPEVTRVLISSRDSAGTLRMASWMLSPLRSR